MSDESKLFGVSVRGWLAIVITLTTCFISLYATIKLGISEVKEPLYTLVIASVSFYLGSKSNSVNGGPNGGNPK